MSEIYKDIEALRVIGFTDREIRDIMKGRRAVSQDDITKLMLGVFNPEKVPKFRKDSGIIKAVDNINRPHHCVLDVDDFNATYTDAEQEDFKDTATPNYTPHYYSGR